MIDTNEEGAQPQELDAFDQAALEAIPDEGPVESEENSDSDLDSGDSDAQDQDIGEDPSPSGSSALLRAMDELNRARIPSALLDGKSEDELLAMGKQAALDRSQRDRQFHERQSQGRETSATDAEDQAPAGQDELVGTDSPETAGTPFDLEAIRTALVDEYGEEAARPHLQVIEDQMARMKRLEDSLQEERRARQLEPIQKVVDETWDGLAVDRPALSEPATRQKVEKLAQQLYELEPELYKDMAPGEWIPQALGRAADAILGPVEPSASPRRRTHAQPTAPSARTKNRPLTADERFDQALLEAIPD